MRVNTTRSKNWTAMIGLALSLALLTPVVGQDSRDTQDKIEELEDRIARLADELHAMRNGHAGKSTESPPFSARSATRLAGYERHREMQDESQFKELEWQFLGPTNISGRVTDIAMPTPRGKSYTMYAATASGGVWRSENEGTTWKSIFEDAASMSIGDVTIAPSDQETVWVGTGEANIFRSSMAGSGVYKSTDGGDHWQHMGLADTHTIPRIIVHPNNPDTVYVASSGCEWTPNPERGVYKSTDGGETWSHVLFIDDMTGVIDLVMDPSAPDTLYAASWERIRKLWNDPRNEDGYGKSGIFKTTDGGRNWRKINEGLPAGRYRGRIGLDLCRAQPNVVYAFVDNYEIWQDPEAEQEKRDESDQDADDEEEEERDSYGRAKTRTIKGAEVYRSDDSGLSWRKVSESNRYMRRLSATYGWVFGQIRVDPVDPDTVYVMGLGLNVSNDSGKTFRRLRGMHGDHHALWIDPENPLYLINGNDGGINVSYDAGENWRIFTDNLPAVQFYNVGYDMDTPFHIYGSIQDHGSRRSVVDLSGGRDRIRAREWERAPGGEASTHAVDPTNPDIVYSEGFYGSISRTNLSTRDRARIAPAAASGEDPLRGQWLAPFCISPHNPRIIYHGMNHLFRSMDQGNSFERISRDLSHDDDDKMGDIPYQTIFSISESPLTFGLIYVGTDDGRVHVTRDSGSTWKDISDGLTEDRWISRAVASKYEEGTVYVAQNGKRNDDFTPYLWKSTDHGDHWSNLSANIPSGPINVIREDPSQAGVLYVGTDLGVYVSIDAGESWEALGNGLPPTFVHDLIIHPRDNIMVIATHGRGMYALDVVPVQEHDQVRKATF